MRLSRVKTRKRYIEKDRKTVFEPEHSKDLTPLLKELKEYFTMDEIKVYLGLMREQKLNLKDPKTDREILLSVLDSHYRWQDMPDSYVDGILEYVRNEQI